MVHREVLDPVRSGETQWDGKYDGVPEGVSLADDDRWEPGKPLGDETFWRRAQVNALRGYDTSRLDGSPVIRANRPLRAEDV